MGAAQEVLSRAAGWITGKAEERRPANSERGSVRGGKLGSTRAYRGRPGRKDDENPSGR